MAHKKGKAVARKAFPRWAWGIILAAVILIAAVAIIQLSKPNQGQALPQEITVAQAAEKRDQGAFLLDVREPDEWTASHIPGATLIPLGELPNRLNEVPRDRDVVVVCRTGHRSAQGRDILLQAGFTRVTSMAGGITAWQAQGLPLQ